MVQNEAVTDLPSGFWHCLRYKERGGKVRPPEKNYLNIHTGGWFFCIADRKKQLVMLQGINLIEDFGTAHQAGHLGQWFSVCGF